MFTENYIYHKLYTCIYIYIYIYIYTHTQNKCMYFCGAKVEARPKSPLFFQVSTSHTAGRTHQLGLA